MKLNEFKVISKNIIPPELKLELLGPGEWVGEPDEFEFKYKKIKCKGLRPNTIGVWCGYCLLPKKHPWRNLLFHEIPTDVHWGLTFSEDGWIGFDCGHLGDLCPRIQLTVNKDKKEFFEKFPKYAEILKSQKIFSKDVYRNIIFVIDQCKLLANEILEVK